MSVSRKRIEAKKKAKKEFKLPGHLQARVPEHYGPLHDFIVSLGGELNYLDAVREFQENWCDHPAGKQEVLVTVSEPVAERHEFILRCAECGAHRHRKGRPRRK